MNNFKKRNIKRKKKKANRCTKINRKKSKRSPSSKINHDDLQN